MQRAILTEQSKRVQVRSASDSAQPTAFVQDGSARVTERAGRTGSAWTLAYRSTHGPTGLLNQNRTGLPADTRWYHTDGLGSVWALTGSNGLVTDKYAYNAYGA